MQHSPNLLFLAFFLATLVSRGDTSTDTAKPQLDKLMTVFPSLYWYASDACMRETSRSGGQAQKHDDFVKDNRANVSKIEETDIKGSNVLKAEVRLLDPKEPNEHWIFEFVYTEGRWNAHTAYKYFGLKRTFDLYEADPFMGSMKPYIQRGLEAFAEEKDFKTIHQKK